MLEHIAQVNNRVLNVTPTKVVRHGINSDTIVPVLDEEWLECTTISVVLSWLVEGVEKSVPYAFTGMPVRIPSEAMEELGPIDVSIVGYIGDEVRYVTADLVRKMQVVESGALTGDYEPTEEELTQIEQAIVEANAAARSATSAANSATEAAQQASDAASKAVNATASAVEATNVANKAADGANKAAQSAVTAASTADKAADTALNAALQAGQTSMAAYADPNNNELIILEYPAFMESDDGGSVYLTLEGEDYA